jgi:hypothetical protein
MLLPLDLREWIPENSMAHFIVEAVSYQRSKEMIELATRALGTC